MEIQLTKEQEQGIIQAVEEYNNWQGHAVLKFDTSYNECWCDVFASNEEWKEYHSDTIHTILCKDNLYERDNKVRKAGMINIIQNGYFEGYLDQYMSEAAVEAYRLAELGRESSQDRWQKKVGLISKSYKLNKSLVEAFSEACEKADITQAKQLSKMMQDFVDAQRGNI